MLQQIVNHLYRFPKSKYKLIKSFGGFRKYRKMLSGQKEMMFASKSLPPIQSFKDGLPVYFLTGKKFLYQTLFCAFSLITNSVENFQFVLIDDGSFDEELTQRAQRQMPGVKIITAKDVTKNLEERLPIKDFPYLHYKRKVYPHIKKLTDLHTILEDPYKLVLDSDMLFWQEPLALIDWLKNPNGAIHMVDCEESYGFSVALMESLSKAKMPELLNVGVFGLNSSSINWVQLEQWAKKLEETEGESYFLEQALSAMITSNQERTVLDSKTYIVNPRNPGNQTSILNHYVGLSKAIYFKKEWKNIQR